MMLLLKLMEKQFDLTIDNVNGHFNSNNYVTEKSTHEKNYEERICKGTFANLKV
jgi:hypothetical protein